MGILLVYDVTDESSFNSILLLLFLGLCGGFIRGAELVVVKISRMISVFAVEACILQLVLSSTLLPSDIRNWIRNIEQHASDNVNKILVGNKADMDESKRVYS